jgi:hypothetical protein
MNMFENIGGIQDVLINVCFIALGFLFRIYLEKSQQIQSDKLLKKKVTQDDWAHIFTASGISNESAQKWHSLLKNQHPSIFKKLSRLIDINPSQR